MKAYKYKFLIWQFNSLIDTGKYDSITVEDVYKHLKAETISSFLIDRFGDEADFSMMEAEDWADLTEEWGNYYNAIDARRKMGVENRGLCLLLGYSLQAVQSHEYNK